MGRTRRVDTHHYHTPTRGRSRAHEPRHPDTDGVGWTLPPSDGHGRPPLLRRWATYPTPSARMGNPRPFRPGRISKVTQSPASSRRDGSEFSLSSCCIRFCTRHGLGDLSSNPEETRDEGLDPGLGRFLGSTGGNKKLNVTRVSASHGTTRFAETGVLRLIYRPDSRLVGSVSSIECCRREDRKSVV